MNAQPTLFAPPEPTPKPPSTRRRRPRRAGGAGLDTEIGLDPITIELHNTTLTITFRHGTPEFDGPTLTEEHALDALGGHSPVLTWCEAVRNEPWIDRPERLRAALDPNSPMTETLRIPPAALR